MKNSVIGAAIAVAVVILAGSFVGIRAQTGVGDDQFLNSKRILARR